MPHEHDQSEFQKDTEGPDITETQVREIAVRELLIEKGILTADQIRKQVEDWEQKTPALGSKIIAHAWCDNDFKKLLLEDGTKAVAQYDVKMGDLELKVIENTPEVHNVVVCTLCSCYPRPVLGIPPAWYKSFNYRRRLIREPRTVLKEFGTDIPEEIIENINNKWFVGVQYHPEFKSTVLNPHPLFKSFMKASLEYYKKSNPFSSYSGNNSEAEFL